MNLRIYFYLAVISSFLLICMSCQIGTTGASAEKPESHDSVVRKIVSRYEKYKVISGTFLGNEQRNYYGEQPPSKLDLIWNFNLGTGKTKVGKDVFAWSGAGWTGQPLLVIQDSVLYLVQGAYDYHLRKINAETGKLVWQYKYDDVIKGTGTIWINENADTLPNEAIILQGSRQGFDNFLSTPVIPSYRAISFVTGDELWRYSSKQTRSYSRDVDGSALLFKDTAYLGLENGIFITFDPNPLKAAIKDNIKQPKVLNEALLFSDTDIKKHGGNLVTESSPAKLGNHIYISSGSGHVFGFNLTTKQIDWDFFIGSDIDGSPVVTSDSCILVSVEKQYIAGKGGVFKLNPQKTANEAVVWYYPTENKNFANWLGGVIGTVGVNDFYRKNNDSIPSLASFIGIDGFLYVVEHNTIDSAKTVLGPDNKTIYYAPKLKLKYKTGPSISTPLIIENKLIAATYDGIYLFEYSKTGEFELLDKKVLGCFESTPVVYNKRIYIASRDGNLYCLGEK